MFPMEKKSIRTAAKKFEKSRSNLVGKKEFEYYDDNETFNANLILPNWTCAFFIREKCKRCHLLAADNFLIN